MLEGVCIGGVLEISPKVSWRNSFWKSVRLIFIGTWRKGERFYFGGTFIWRDIMSKLGQRYSQPLMSKHPQVKTPNFHLQVKNT